MELHSCKYSAHGGGSQTRRQLMINVSDISLAGGLILDYKFQDPEELGLYSYRKLERALKHRNQG